jgi:tetratricopeptide (TPR) repeat protein
MKPTDCPTLPNAPRRLAVFGTGDAARREIERLSALPDVECLACADNDPRKQGGTFMGLPVVAPSQLADMPFDAIVVASIHADAIQRQLAHDLGVPPRKIAYAPAILPLLVRKALSAADDDAARRWTDEAQRCGSPSLSALCRAEIAMARREWNRAAECFEAIGIPLLSAPPAGARASCPPEPNSILETCGGYARAPAPTAPSTTHNDNGFASIDAATFFTPGAIADWGRALRMLGRFDEAEHILQKGLSIFPGASEPTVQLAEVAMARDDWPRAISTYESLLPELPPHAAPPIHARLACAFRKAGDLDPAKTAIDQGLSLDPASVPLRVQLAEWHLATRNAAAAVEVYEALLAESPHPAPPDLYARLGFACRTALAYDRAESVLAQGRALHPDHPAIAEEFARIAYVRSDFAAAALRWRRVWDLEHVPRAFHSLIASLRYQADHEAMADAALDMGTRHNSSLQSQPWTHRFSTLCNLAETVSDDDLFRHLQDFAARDPRPPAEWWHALYYRLFLTSHVAPAYRCKAIAAQMAADPDSPYLADRNDVLGARLQLDSAASAARLVEEEIRNARTPQKRFELHADLAILRFLAGDADAAQALWNGPEFRSELNESFSPEFAELVGGKSVAIVGGADVPLESGEEIDSFDVVVRTQFFNAPLSDDAARRMGRKTTVSYYNHSVAVNRMDDIAASADGLTAVVLNTSQPMIDKLRRLNPRVIARSNPNYPFSVFMGIPLAALRIVLDLLPYAPRRIKAFNADFYLGGQSHHPAYSKIPGHLPIMLAHHDIHANIRQTNAFFKAAKAESDPRLAEIFAMPDSDIFATIQNRWTTTRL